MGVPTWESLHGSPYIGVPTRDGVPGNGVHGNGYMGVPTDVSAHW